MNRKQLQFGYQIKSIDEKGEFSGYGSVFGTEDSYGDVVVKGAFVKSLARHEQKGTNPAMLWQHKYDEPIGIWKTIEEDDNGLYLEGKLLINDDLLAKRAYAHMKAGSLTGLSIGYSLVDYDYDKAKDVWLLKEIELWEVSPVTFPANDEARVEDVKSMLLHGKIPEAKILERSLHDIGLDQQQIKRFMNGGYKELNDQDNNQVNQELKKLNQIFKGN